jgi:hypothetical protein
MTDEDLAALREMVAEPYSEAWDDDRLRGAYDRAGGSLNGAAGILWRAKANEAAALVDVTENGSSRKLGDLYGKLSSVAAAYEGAAAAETGAPATGGRVRVRQIVRP